jgi:regulatory protein
MPASRPQRPAGPPPSEASLREAALAHLARFGTTEAGLARVLRGRVDRWARRAIAEGQEEASVAALAAACRALVAPVAQAMVRLGAVDDAQFAAARARRLHRGGRSARAIAAHLAAKGVDPATARAALEGREGDELDAALAFLRRRRAGPFGPPPADPLARRKLLAALARGGFAHDVAEAALRLDPEAAEARLIAARAR